MTTRRSFLSALVGLPLVGRFLPKPDTYTVGDEADIYMAKPQHVALPKRVSMFGPDPKYGEAIREYANVYGRVLRDYERYYR